MAEQQGSKQVQSATAVDEESFRNGVERARGRLVCWTMSGQLGVNLLPQALDIGDFIIFDLSRIAASKGVQRKLIEVAEAAGYSQEICSYNKVPLGYALLLARGQLDLVPEVPPMLRPDFIWGAVGCQSQLWFAEVLGQILDVPVIAIYLPFEYDIANRERNLRYIESQLRDALDVLETWTGRLLDLPRLGERIRGLAEVADMRAGVAQLGKTCPSVCSALDLIPAAYVHRACLVEESKRIYGALREEIEGKIERGERDVPDEKLRIHWVGSFPWGLTGAIKELLARHGATLCASQTATGGSPPERGVGLDPGNPLGTAAWLLEESGANKSVDTRIEEWIKPTVEGYNVDGIIFQMPRTCKINAIPVAVLAAQVGKDIGVPTFILESDAIDPAFYDETQVENRIESFLESIARTKAGG